MKRAKLDRLILSSIYDILIRCCGASEYEQDRLEFVNHALAHDPSRTLEWRFQGWLGFGGKIWLYNSDVPYVNFYPEDSNPSRERSALRANDELNELFSHGR
jgi:hypothetical protein